MMGMLVALFFPGIKFFEYLQPSFFLEVAVMKNFEWFNDT